MWGAASDPKEAAQVELRLLGVLSSAASIEAKQFVCRQLRLVGSESAIPFLGRLLNDPELSHLARYALEPMPSFSAGTALRQALQTTRGELLLGVINSLGERREPASVPALISQLNSPHAATVQAAVSALGKIGGETALDALRAVAVHYDPGLARGGSITVALSDEAKRRLDVAGVFDALLACAERLFRQDRIELAAETFARIYQAPPVPRPQRFAALTGLTRTAPDRAAPMLLLLLRSRDSATQAAAIELLRQLPPAAAAPIAALLETFPAAQQALLIEALAARADRTLLFPLLKASVSPDPAVRVAALRAFATQQGNRQAVQLLLGVASGETTEGVAARESLDRLQGPEVDADLVAQLDQTSVAMRSEAARSLGARGATNAVPRLLKALNDANAPVRFAALESLGRLGAPQQFPVLLAHLAKAGSPAERELAAKAVLALARRTGATSPREARAATEEVLESATGNAVHAEAIETLDVLRQSQQTPESR